MVGYNHASMVESFEIKSLAVAIGGTEILRGVSLTVQPGELHVIMGPNGSGKSTLAATLAGHPSYEVTAGSVALDGDDLLTKSPDERANTGLFLAFQYPVEVPGVTVQHFLRQAHEARFADQPEKRFAKVLDFRQHLATLADQLHVPQELLKRGLNEGFSGGEKKRLEILQLAVLEPRYAILDETDSGLDIDAIKHVAAGVNTIRERFKTGIIVITHYQRILQFLKPDTVHLMVTGRIVQSGGPDLVAVVEETGYTPWQAPGLEPAANSASDS